MKNNTVRSLLLVIVILFVFDNSVLATVQSASKSCQFPNQPCTIVPVANTIVIATAQTVHWQANYNPFQQNEGNDFALSTSGNDNSPDVIITSNLSLGNNQGDFLLQPGNYRIAVGSFSMGSGSYSITYNIGVTMAVAAPTTFDFG